MGNISDTEALEAAKVIQQYCRDHGKIDTYCNMYCKGCIFNNHICVLNDPDHLPETWELNKLGSLIIDG